MSNFKQKSMKHRNKLGLELNTPPSKPPEPSGSDSQIPGALGNNVATIDTLEIGVEFNLDLKADELIVIRELGAGNGGTVSKVMHPATRVVMARKVRLVYVRYGAFVKGISLGYSCRCERKCSQTDC